MKITVGCIFCGETFEGEIETPPGWETRYDEWELEELGFCPKHAAAAPFADNQCPGCVASWGGKCPLWQAFAYPHRRTVTEVDLATIRKGICPRRVNGTIGFSPAGGMETLDLSEVAPSAAGTAMEAAVREYIERWQ